MKLKKGDTVQVMIGKDKGKVSKITEVIPSKNMVMVEGINQFKRHVKARVQNQKSEIVTITKPLSASKVSLVDPKKKKPTRIGYSVVNGKKERVARKSGAKI